MIASFVVVSLFVIVVLLLFSFFLSLGTTTSRSSSCTLPFVGLQTYCANMFVRICLSLRWLLCLSLRLWEMFHKGGSILEYFRALIFRIRTQCSAPTTLANCSTRRDLSFSDRQIVPENQIAFAGSPVVVVTVNQRGIAAVALFALGGLSCFVSFPLCAPVSNSFLCKHYY